MRQPNATLTESASNKSYFIAFETFVIEGAVEAEIMGKKGGLGSTRSFSALTKYHLRDNTKIQK